MRKFGRKKGQRKSFLKTLAGNLIMREKIETTEARAKELASIVGRLLTIARRGGLANHRLLLSRLTKDAANKLFYEIAPKYKERGSGQIRVLKTMGRKVRNAEKISVVEFI